MLGATAAAVRLTHWFCETVMFRVVSARWLAAAPFSHPLRRRAARAKFTGAAWQLVIHASMATAEAYVLWGEPWIAKPWLCFFPNPEDFTPKTSLRMLFVAQMAVWVFTCISHRFNSDAHAHKDYFAMYIHHLATIGLVALAYANNDFKVGAVVLFIHDISDIGIDLLKMSNYLRLDGRAGWFIVELSFALTLSLWSYFRLYLFPFSVIGRGTLPSLATTAATTFPDGSLTLATRMKALLGDWTAEYTRFYISAVTCNVLLSVLVVLHIWWFGLLLKILYRAITSDSLHDAGADAYEGASDDEGEGEGETESGSASADASEGDDDESNNSNSKRDRRSRKMSQELKLRRKGSKEFGKGSTQPALQQTTC